MKTPSYQDKKVAVLGAGESGEKAALLLCSKGARVTVLDTAPAEKLAAKAQTFAERGIALIAGEAAASDPAAYDLVVLSPGIDPVTPLVRHFFAKPCPMIGELELAFGLCECPVIAITGTNGKTTTTQLVEKMLNAAGVQTLAGGNIGPAFSGVVERSAELDVVTLEVSSFQLELISDFHANVSVWLGFAADHLDRYPSMTEYYAAKVRVFENQTAEDWAVINFRDCLPPIAARKITFSAFVHGADFDLRDGVIFHKGVPVLPMADTQLRGAHNAENLMAAMGVGLAQDLNFEDMLPALCAYKALPHRCEVLGSHAGVEWVNDSKGTNLDSVEKALLSENRPVVLIAGGKDKGFEFEALTELVSQKCRAVICLGEMANRIEGLWKGVLPCSNAGSSLETAVEMARVAAQRGDVVLFSPGTSSFDMFKNYAERGNQFRALVAAFSTPPTV